MSDRSFQNQGNEFNMSQHPCFKQCLHNLNQLNSDNLITVTECWTRIYGKNDSRIAEKTESVEKALAQFWEIQIDHLESRKKSLLESIEQIAKEAFELEKALGIVDGGMNRSIDDGEIPLVEWEEQVWKQLNSYQEQKQQRIEEYSKLQIQEEELCAILDESPMFTSYIEHSKSLSGAMGPGMNFPNNEVMARCEERINQLKALRDQLEYDFESYKDELKNLLRECELPPLSKPECFACSTEDDTFPPNKKNLNKLKASTEHHRQKKQQMIEEAARVRQEITALSKKMLKDPQELEDFFSQNEGFTKPVIEKLKEKLKAMKEERKIKLKDLILGHRNLLDDLWTRCCFSDNQRAQFRPYSVNHYTEEVLTFHELQVEEVEQFYNDNKRIFQLADKFKELWARLLQLENQSSQSDRLFNNRGGRLLQEEKERKLIQKKVPAIKSELDALLDDFKNKTGTEFLLFGDPLREQLRQMEEEREASKENQKLMRALLRSEGTDVVRVPPLTPKRAAGCYATIRTPTHKTPSRTPARTPAASTPENGAHPDVQCEGSLS